MPNFESLKKLSRATKIAHQRCVKSNTDTPVGPIEDAASITSPPLNSQPCFAASPDETVITVGVARPKAHGQATTRTAIASCRANPTGV